MVRIVGLIRTVIVGHVIRRGTAASLVACVLLVGRTREVAAQSAADTVAPTTLDDALREARAANALLPVAGSALLGAVARAQQARGGLYPRLSLDGDVHGGVPQSYASSDALFRVLAQAPLYEGGALRAALARSDAEAAALRAGYRAAARDVDYAVRVAYARAVLSEEALALRRRGIERLEAYLSVVQSRGAAGQGVAADLLRTRQRLATAAADMATIQRNLDETRMELNDLMGRAPGAALALAPLPEPAPPSDTTGQPWLATPDVAQSQAQVLAASADARAARAGRKPSLSLEADAGVQPVLGSDVSPYNVGRGWGAQILVAFSLPVWDAGLYRGRVAEATAALDQARQQETVARRGARLNWTRAAVDLGNLYREYEARQLAAGVAQDAYLLAASLYRGGQGTALEVLDAYDAWTASDQNLLDARYGYRVALATLIRWGNQ
jgi:outer membrane protein